jgi:hypothetical protein
VRPENAIRRGYSARNPRRETANCRREHDGSQADAFLLDGGSGRPPCGAPALTIQAKLVILESTLRLVCCAVQASVSLIA